jgi:hypothetical protein
MPAIGQTTTLPMPLHESQQGSVGGASQCQMDVNAASLLVVGKSTRAFDCYGWRVDLGSGGGEW